MSRKSSLILNLYQLNAPRKNSKIYHSSNKFELPEEYYNQRDATLIAAYKSGGASSKLAFEFSDENFHARLKSDCIIRGKTKLNFEHRVISSYNLDELDLNLNLDVETFGLPSQIENNYLFNLILVPQQNPLDMADLIVSYETEPHLKKISNLR